MSLSIVPLETKHLERATAMAAARYRAARAQTAYMPSRFERPEAILSRLQDHVGSVPSVAAIQRGRVVGFLSSLLVQTRGERLAVVPDFGHAAIAEGGYDVYRRMYAAIADQWLANGCFWHAITLYPHERAAIEAWFSVGFGLAVIDALQPLAREWDTVQLPPGLDLRRGRLEDVDAVTPLELGLERHLSASPAYLPLLIERGRSGWEKWLADETHALWLAFKGDVAVGYLRFQPSEGLVLPTALDQTVAITGAFTREDVRGRGVGTALLQRGFEWARGKGYEHCSVDFESANLPGSRFWLGSGFVPVCHSLMRRVNPALAWANVRRDAVDVRRAYEGQTWVG